MIAGANVQIDLRRVLQNVARIARQVRVPVLAVVKADAYGLGARRIGETIAPFVSGFCTFSLDEAIDAKLHRLARPILTLGPVGADDTPARFIRHNARPAVWDAATARRMRDAHPVVSLDTGMQRFACPRDQFDHVLRAGACNEAFTHATRISHVRELKRVCAGTKLRLHASGTALLDEPEARLDAVRPGLALYRGAVRVSATLIDARDTHGRAGYGRFLPRTRRHGVILVGYRQGLRPGTCRVNGEIRRILEVGMQSAFVEIGKRDRIGDEVVLLGDTLEEQTISAQWNTSPQEVLVRLTAAGAKAYVDH